MMFTFGSFVLDVGRRQLLENGGEVHLSPKALLLLQMLLEERPKAVSRAQIHDRLWPNTFVVDSNVGAIVNEVRKAISDPAQSPRFIRTVHGYGYAFQLEEGAMQPMQPIKARVVWKDGEASLVEGVNEIGRDREVRVHIDDRTVSRRHAVITIDAAGATLEDLGSKNGTFVDGRRITKVALADEMAFDVGSVRMLFRVAGDGSTQSLFVP